MIWYKVPKRLNLDTGEYEPDTDDAPYYAIIVNEEYYLLYDGVLEFPILTNEEVAAEGINPNRSITGV